MTTKFVSITTIAYDNSNFIPEDAEIEKQGTKFGDVTNHQVNDIDPTKTDFRKKTEEKISIFNLNANPGEILAGTETVQRKSNGEAVPVELSDNKILSLKNNKTEEDHGQGHELENIPDVVRGKVSKTRTRNLPDWSCCLSRSDKSECLVSWKKFLKFGQEYFCLWPLLILVTWALLYVLWWEGAKVLPGGSLFALFVLQVSATVLGQVMEWFNLPPLIGMLAAGLLCRNLPGSSIGRDLTIELSAPLRAISVVILLTRGAFTASPMTIRRFARIIPQLAFMTCVVEAIVGGTTVYFLTNFPIPWAGFIGCMMSGMSQVVLLPFLQTLDTEKFGGGANKKVMTIIRGGCGLDAILSISLAECCLGFIFGDGDIADGLTKGVLEVAMGAAFGIFWGALSGHLLNQNHAVEVRAFAVIAGGVMSLVGLNKIGYPRAGPSGIWVGSLVCSIIWRRRQIDGENNNLVQDAFTKSWFLFQPILFGVIGIRTDLSTVDWRLMGMGLICLSCALAARLLTAVLMSTRASLTWRQMLFVAICWIPKGTVQADLGPMAIDMVIAAHFGPEAEGLARQAMNMAVLTIFFGSILGSFALLVIGPRLLPRGENETLKAINCVQ